MFYDTLKIFIPYTDIINPNYAGVFNDVLTDKNQLQNSFGYSMNGKYKNLNIKLSRHGITIEGSIHKYIKGYNLEPTTLKEFENAIFELSNVFQLDLMQGIVKRLDYSHNIIVEKKPSAYLCLFLDMPRMTKKTYAKTENIQYSNTYKTLVMYDKILDAKDKKQTISNEFLNKNVLRIELRYLKRLEKRFNVKQFLVSELLKPEFNAMIFENWKNEYFKIKRLKQIDMSNDKKITAKKIEEIIVAQLLNSDNSQIESILNAVKINSDAKEINRFKSKYNKMLSNEKDNELLQELDIKIKSIKPIV